MNTGGKVPCLWNHDAISGAPRVLIAEGEVDALTAIEAGQVGVGLPGWSHWKDEWTADFRGKDVVLVMDADKGGDQGTWDIARRFLKAGQPTPRQIILPDGEDLNSYFLKSMKG
jgi:DNA primase